LKPGGHLLAFSGNRTHHRLFTGVEDAGFEIRDTLTWHYGSGFPKASDVSKTIDKRADAEREVVGKGQWYGRVPNGRKEEGGDEKYGVDERTDEECNVVTAPATDAAKKWDGWKTGLKPATEYVVMARKSYDGATVDSVLEHGTGALNIDECRVEAGERPNRAHDFDDDRDLFNVGTEIRSGNADGTTTEGRYPANVVFGEQAAGRLDSKNDDTKAGNGNGGGEGGIWNESVDGKPVSEEYGDEGGISRYFYTSKATKAERTLDGKIDNAHPTVKPGDLMEWLIKLVTAEEQTVLDPFAGSGTTLKAAKDLNRQFIGIEKQARWADVARVRAGLTPNDPSHVRDTDDAQSGLEAYN
jgi:site-specific DNA-methyltransferase (adenine-specific)